MVLNGFSSEQIVSSTSGATSAIAADVNGDGHLDIVASLYNSNQVGWYQNDGTGVFGRIQVIDFNASLATRVYAADIDADGDADILSASPGAGVNAASNSTPTTAIGYHLGLPSPRFRTV